MGARLTDCPMECPFAYLDSSLCFLPLTKHGWAGPCTVVLYGLAGSN